MSTFEEKVNRELGVNGVRQLFIELNKEVKRHRRNGWIIRFDNILDSITQMVGTIDDETERQSERWLRWKMKELGVNDDDVDITLMSLHDEEENYRNVNY